MKETKLYSKLRPQLVKWGAIDRVENVLGSGMSDVFFNITGKTGWLETKVAKGNEIYFEKFQPNWMRKHIRNGLNRIFVIVMDRNDSILVYKAIHIIEAPMCPKKDWLIVQLSDLPEPEIRMTTPYREWELLRQVLIS